MDFQYVDPVIAGLVLQYGVSFGDFQELAKQHGWTAEGISSYTGNVQLLRRILEARGEEKKTVIPYPNLLEFYIKNRYCSVLEDCDPGLYKNPADPLGLLAPLQVRVAARVCPCGCGEPLQKSARFAGKKCSARAKTMRSGG